MSTRRVTELRTPAVYATTAAPTRSPAWVTAAIARGAPGAAIAKATIATTFPCIGHHDQPDRESQRLMRPVLALGVSPPTHAQHVAKPFGTWASLSTRCRLLVMRHVGLDALGRLGRESGDDNGSGDRIERIELVLDVLCCVGDCGAAVLAVAWRQRSRLRLPPQTGPLRGVVGRWSSVSLPRLRPPRCRWHCEPGSPTKRCRAVRGDRMWEGANASVCGGANGDSAAVCRPCPRPERMRSRRSPPWLVRRRRRERRSRPGPLGERSRMSSRRSRWRQSRRSPPSPRPTPRPWRRSGRCACQSWL
jgi:hypothetical protein